jgi:uncharacterized membrane protein YhaH (DUF805 family)
MKWYLAVLKKYAIFQGRARRKEYWYFFLFNLLFAYAVAFFSIWIKLPSLYVIYVLALLIPGIAVGVRRMHDVNKSGWFILIPIYNLILCCTEGTQGPNQYGEDAKRPEFEEFLQEAGPSQN